MNHLPYVSVTGITERGQAEAIRNRLRARGLEGAGGRRLVFGILGSRKTLLDKKPNKYPHRYPRAEQMAHLFTPNNPMDPLDLWLHYCDEERAGDGTTLFQRVSEAVEVCLPEEETLGVVGPMGIQINATWPDPRQMTKIAAEFPEMEICLQVGPKAMEQKPPNTPAFYEAIDAYAWKIDHVLLDFSAGEGKPLDLSIAQELAYALRDEYPCLGVGIAGGLCAERIYEAAHLLCSIPRISTDMEGAVRIPTDGGGILDIDRAVDGMAAHLQITTLH